MFKLNQSATFWWPVTLNVPVNGGNFQKATFDLEFKRITTSELEAMQEDVLRGRIKDKEAAKAIVANWRGVEDEAGAVEFSSSAMDRLLEVPNMATAIASAYAEALSGQKRKN